MRTSLAVGAAMLGLVTASPALAAPQVVATILPIHSLTAAVMAGVGEPRLLLEPGVSPHAYSLKPSEAAALEDADLVLWIGPAMETFLASALESLARDAHTRALMDAPGVTVLDSRAGGMWDAHEDHDAASSADDHGHADDHDHDHDHASHDHGGADAHIWLSIDNARAMTLAIADELEHVDPANAAAYDANAAALVAALEALEGELDAALAPVREVPYVVFHDAYRYFEAEFGLNALGSITVSPDQQPGAQRIAELRRKIETLGAACVFAEPQFEPRLVATLIDGTAAHAAVLDPVGAEVEPGPGAYETLMRGLADSLKGCLIGAS